MIKQQRLCPQGVGARYVEWLVWPGVPPYSLRVRGWGTWVPARWTRVPNTRGEGEGKEKVYICIQWYVSRASSKEFCQFNKASMHKRVFLCKYRKDSLSSYISDALSEIEPLDDSEQNIELHQVKTSKLNTSNYYIVHNIVWWKHFIGIYTCLFNWWLVKISYSKISIILDNPWRDSEINWSNCNGKTKSVWPL